MTIGGHKRKAGGLLRWTSRERLEMWAIIFPLIRFWFSSALPFCWRFLSVCVAPQALQQLCIITSGFPCEGLNPQSGRREKAWGRGLSPQMPRLFTFPSLETTVPRGGTCQTYRMENNAEDIILVGLSSSRLLFCYDTTSILP